VLVAGATSVPGIPLLGELNARGHEVIGMTSQPARTSAIEQQGAKPVVANVFDARQINTVVGDIQPEVVVPLLTTLPKWGPKRPKDFEPARMLWGQGAPNLVAAAQRAGVRRVVAESVVFAYGYPTSGPQLVDESDPCPASTATPRESCCATAFSTGQGCHTTSCSPGWRSGGRCQP
jgi:nucleoside-diphosphate-sugar epimerase